jgi:hypothetical protein
MSTWSTIAMSDMASAVGSVSKSAFRARKQRHDILHQEKPDLIIGS